MATPTTPTNTLPPTEIEPDDFWADHKGKIIGYGLLLLVALAAFIVYQAKTARDREAARVAFAAAADTAAYQQVAQDFPKTTIGGDARLLLAAAQRDEQKYDEAIATLRAFMADTPEHPLIAGAWLSLGETQSVAGKTDEAIDTYRQIGTRYPDSFAAPAATLALARALADAGRIDEATREYENLIARHSQSLVVRQGEAQGELARLAAKKTTP